jgi:hypothetical protein
LRPDDAIRLRHMLDAAREGMSFAAGRSREDLERDRMLVLAIVNDVDRPPVIATALWAYGRPALLCVDAAAALLSRSGSRSCGRRGCGEQGASGRPVEGGRAEPDGLDHPRELLDRPLLPPHHREQVQIEQRPGR